MPPRSKPRPFHARCLATAALSALVLAGAAGCGGGDGGVVEAVRESLPDGSVRVHYPALPDSAALRLAPDLTLGVLEGEPWEMFGDVRGIDADAQGRIHVLDVQARSIRVFDADGRYLHTLSGPGEGPGEITAANGLHLDAEGTLWVSDYGKMHLLALRPDGTEATRVPFPVPGWGFIWQGMMDREGRIWAQASQRDGPVTMPPEGLNETRSRLHMKWLDPATGATDSVYVGPSASRSFVINMEGGGFSMRGIPHDVSGGTTLDPLGGFWTRQGAEYRLVRLDPEADTVLRLEADLPRLAVTDADREAVIAGMVEQNPALESAARDLVGHMPARKAAFDQLFADEAGRVWVRRVVERDAEPVYDLFSREGEHLVTLALNFRPQSWWTPVVRGGHAYFLVAGVYDVAQVFRVPLEGVPDPG
jgi:streptogramin lyase